MALKTMIENLNKAREAYETQLAGLGKNAQKAVAEFLSPFIPPGYAVKWAQYTPYFNDGDACTFGVREPTLVRLGASKAKDEDDEDDSDGIEFGTAIERYGQPDEEKSYETDDYTRELPRQPGQSLYQRTFAKKTVTYVEPGFPKIEGWTKAKLKELPKAWGELPEDLLENAFGDHVEVIIKHTGKFTVSEYRHD